VETNIPYWELHNGMRLIHYTAVEWPSVILCLSSSWQDSHHALWINRFWASRVAKLAQVISKLKITIRAKCIRCSSQLWPKRYDPKIRRAEKLLVVQLVKFPNFYETWRFIIVFAATRHCPIPWGNYVHTHTSQFLTFSLEDGGSMFLQNVVIYLQIRMVLQTRRPTSTY
jgi:hypothetical protein